MSEEEIKETEAKRTEDTDVTADTADTTDTEQEEGLVEIEWGGMLQCLLMVTVVPLVISAIGISLALGFNYIGKQLEGDAGAVVVGVGFALGFFYMCTKGFHLRYAVPWSKAALCTVVQFSIGIGILAIWGALTKARHEGAVMAIPGFLGLVWALFTMNRLLPHAMTEWYLVEFTSIDELALEVEDGLRGLKIKSANYELIEDSEVKVLMAEGAEILLVNTFLAPKSDVFYEALKAVEEGKLNHLLLEISSDGEMAEHIKLVKKQVVAQ